MAISQTLIPNLDRNTLNREIAFDSKMFGGDLSQVTEKGVFASLAESIHDLVFAPKQAPLVLSSKPLFLPNRMTVERNPMATGFAIAINGLIVVSLLWFGTHKVAPVLVQQPAKVMTLVDPLPPPPLPKAPPKAITMSGGGGQPTPLPVAKGNPPKLEIKPTIMPMPTAAPKIALATQPTINVQTELKMAKAEAPNLGMSNAPAVAVSMGNGSGAGLGAGLGNGMGAGSGGNYGGGVFKIGGGVSEPVVLSAPAPGFTEEARQAKVAGKVVVYLQVSQDGRAMHVRVVRGLGMGLDEKAVEAVRQYKFKPAMRDGRPVTVEMNVEVNFQIF